MKMKARDTLYDSLKGISIIGIVVTHMGFASRGDFIGTLSVHGARGVQFFFVIGTFFLFKSLAREFEQKKYTIKEISFWYMNKFIRLIPLFYLFNLYCLIRIQVFQGDGNYISSFFSQLFSPAIISNFLFLHGLNPFWISAININWYIGTFSIFVLLSPFLYKLFNNISLSFFFVALSIIFFDNINIFFNTLININNNEQISNFMLVQSFVAQGSTIAIGLFVFHLEKCINFKAFKSKVIISITFILISIWLFYAHIMGSSNLLSPTDTFSIIALLLIIGLNIQNNILLINPVFSALGKYSYGMYLSHIFFITYVNTFVDRFISFDYLNVCVKIILTLILSFITSYILTSYLEKPLINLAQKFIKTK